MKKKINIEKRVVFRTLIGEICAISLEHNLKFLDEVNVGGELTLSGKYKLTEASRIEEDFRFDFPVEIVLTEKLDLNTTKIEISDFYYEIENDDIMICYIELDIEGVEIVDFCEDLFEERECDGDINKEKEIPIKEKDIPIKEILDEKEDLEKKDNLEDIVEDERVFVKEEETKLYELKNDEELEKTKEEKEIDFMNFDEENETYGTFVVYIVRQNETVNSILEKYNTTLEEIEKYNDLKNIEIGTKLIIPLLRDNDKQDKK